MRPERTHETQETQKTYETQKSHETHETQETQKTHETQHYKLIIYRPNFFWSKAYPIIVSSKLCKFILDVYIHS